jgi:hypothetical protein
MMKMLFRRGPERGAVSVRVRIDRFLSEILVAMFRKFIRDAGKTQFYDRESLVGG